MFARMIDDFKDSTSTAVRLTSLAAVIAVALARHGLVSVRRSLRLRVADLRPDPGLPDGRRHFPSGGADRGHFLCRAQEQGQGARQGSPEIGGPPRAGRSRCWSPPASRSSAPSASRELIPILAVGGLALGLLASRNAPSRRGGSAGGDSHLGLQIFILDNLAKHRLEIVITGLDPVIPPLLENLFRGSMDARIKIRA